MYLLDRIEYLGEAKGSRLAVHSHNDCITYKGLAKGSGRLAFWLDKQLGNDKTPVLVYGHKSPLMILCFLACVKSGRAYCPVDVSVPRSRVIEIAEAMETKIILATEDIDMSSAPSVNAKEIYEIAYGTSEEIERSKWVKPTDIFYIIYTSGSTGKPKGVQITYHNLSNFLNWSSTVTGSPSDEAVFLNQAPFSFDLSVMDLYTCLYAGGMLWTVNRNMQRDMASLFSSLRASGITTWVSTPSFADLCLSDPAFCSKLMPDIEQFLFCGETLKPGTAETLMNRFPHAQVVNMYGPTESTVAVTNITITDKMVTSGKPLPVGIPMPEAFIEIWDENGKPVTEGTKGEIVIICDSVSPGYFRNRVATVKNFFTCSRSGRICRGYHTGDEGYMENGILYYCGRIDLQVKLHGYRIEVEDIENNLLKEDDILATAVVPKLKGDVIKCLVAFIVKNSNSANEGYEEIKQIKSNLKKHLPEYMIPKKLVFINEMPITNNGKADRKKLREMV
ncbi:MAG: D-alanine--poly(phosphoribitol) ligase subunit DltA [Clostridiales bacterium]|nr:D-alanine--poly(phosphoribitol) ligase subunit DltA [Clostridiales bacterium]